MARGEQKRPTTRISKAYPDRVEVRGRDLAGDLMGRLTFTEYFHLLLTGREPTDEERFFLDLLLVSIAEHGLMPSNVAARMTLAADPASLHGAVAAGILGAGAVVLGTSEACARLLEETRASGREPAEVVRELGERGERVPGFGHPLHDPVDPRPIVVYLELPTGQVSWHLPAHPEQWDGHDTATKYDRIAAYVR